MRNDSCHITASAAGIANFNEDDAVSYDLKEGRDGRSQLSPVWS